MAGNGTATQTVQPHHQSRLDAAFLGYRVRLDCRQRELLLQAQDSSRMAGFTSGWAWWLTLAASTSLIWLHGVGLNLVTVISAALHLVAGQIPAARKFVGDFVGTLMENGGKRRQ